MSRLDRRPIIAIDDVRDILKRVGEGAPRWHFGLPKPQQVGSDEAKPVRELRHEIAEHVADWKRIVAASFGPASK